MPSAPKRHRARTPKPASSRQKVSAHRKRLRAQGLRPIQIWVPDTRSPKFAAQASRQSRLVASSPHASEDQAFIDALSNEIEQ
jgi:hypothetical protein